MSLIGFFKGQPTDYIIKYVAGRVVQEGAGLAFYYWKHKTQIVAIPTSSTDAPFVFKEVTSNFQEVTLQGQLTYRIQRPQQTAGMLNFTIDPRQNKYASNDPERLSQRIINIVQMETRSQIQRRSMEETLREAPAIAAAVLQRIREGDLVAAMGVELLSVYFLSSRPTPEVAKALEAEYRETLLRKADEAIYARRAAAVEEERKIKENELHTEISLEQQRQELIALQGANAMQEAENQAKAEEVSREYARKHLEQELAIYRSTDPRTLLGIAFKDMGMNAQRLGNLTITTEILAGLLNGQTGPGGPEAADGEHR